jgi:hypothetical protein
MLRTIYVSNGAALAVAAAIALAACQGPDVGQPCKLDWNTTGTPPPPTPQTATGIYFEDGNLACDELVCIISPAGSDPRYSSCSDPTDDVCGYCSKPCVSNNDCFTSKTGLVCQQILLDPAYLATLSPTVRQTYLADVAYSSYCVAP